MGGSTLPGVDSQRRNVGDDVVVNVLVQEGDIVPDRNARHKTVDKAAYRAAFTTSRGVQPGCGSEIQARIYAQKRQAVSQSFQRLCARRRIATGKKLHDDWLGGRQFGTLLNERG